MRKSNMKQRLKREKEIWICTSKLTIIFLVGFAIFTTFLLPKWESWSNEHIWQHVYANTPKIPIIEHYDDMEKENKQAGEIIENKELIINTLIDKSIELSTQVNDLREYNKLIEEGKISKNVDIALMNNINNSIKECSAKYDVEEELIRAIIKQESNFDFLVVSHAGAEGLMQLMPGTAELLGVENTWDIQQNIDGGTRYIKDMLNMFNGNTKLALAGYNAGPGAVKKYGGIPPYNETQHYVKQVLYYYNAFKGGN